MKAPFLRRVELIEPTSSQVYPFSIPLFKNGLALDFTTALTIFIGENGSGKSTLLEAIAANCGFSPNGGGRSHVFDAKQEVSKIADRLRCSWLPKINEGFFLRADSFLHFANYLDELSDDSGPKALRAYGGKSLNQMSHGEAFLAMFLHRFDGKGIYILDEPEAALSPQRQLVLIKLLMDLSASGKAQIIMATHSPMLIAIPNARLLSIKDDRLEETNYRSTSHFQIVKRFLSDPERYIGELSD